MAEHTSIGLTLNIIWINLFMIACVASFIFMVNSEGREEVFDGYPEIQSFNLNLTDRYADDLIDVSNKNMNLSAQYNTELAISAADRTGNAMFINWQDLISISWDSISIFFRLIFGNVWTATLSGIMIALVLLVASAYAIKWARTGT